MAERATKRSAILETAASKLEAYWPVVDLAQQGNLPDFVLQTLSRTQPSIFGPIYKKRLIQLYDMFVATKKKSLKDSEDYYKWMKEYIAATSKYAVDFDLAIDPNRVITEYDAKYFKNMRKRFSDVENKAKIEMLEMNRIFDCLNMSQEKGDKYMVYPSADIDGRSPYLSFHPIITEVGPNGNLIIVRGGLHDNQKEGVMEHLHLIADEFFPRAKKST